MQWQVTGSKWELEWKPRAAVCPEDSGCSPDQWGRECVFRRVAESREEGTDGVRKEF